MRSWVFTIVVILLATLSGSAQYRYFVTGSVFYGSCATLRVEMGDQDLNFTKPAGNGSSSSLIAQTITTPTLIGSSYRVNWFLVGDQSCCAQQQNNCGPTGWTNVQLTSPNCYTLSITYGGWNLRIFFTRLANPTVGTPPECDNVLLSTPTDLCYSSAVTGWYVTDKTNPVEADWKLLGWTGNSVRVTAALVASVGIGDPYGPLFVGYRLRSTDPNLGFSEFSGKVPIDLYHAGPQMTFTPRNQLCDTRGGVTITNIILPLPKVKLTLSRNGTQIVMEDVEYTRAGLENRFFELDEGTYRMSARNWGGSDPADVCYAFFDFVVLKHDPTIDITAVPSHETCFGPANTGSIILTPGGTDITPPYTYAWAHDANLPDKDLTGLAGDKTYSVTVKDKNGCVGTKDIWIEEPDQIEVTEAYVSSSHNGADVSCPANTVGIQNDGAIHLAAQGGTGQLTYRLEGDAHAARSQTSGDFTNLSADVYKIYVKDIRGCEIEHAIDVPVTAPPDIRHSRMTVVPLRCNGIAEGTITVVNARGGTGTLMYGIAGANYQASNVISNRNGQTYTVSIHDANGCRRDTAVVVAQPSAITFDPIALLPQSCAAVVDGALTASASGGTGVIKYALTDSDIEYKTTGVFGPLLSGTYIVYARDANNCVVPSAAQLLPMKPAINAAISVKDSISCHGEQDGALRLTIRGGGTAPYSILWADERGTTEDISALGAATYSVTVTDAKSCQQSWTFPLPEPGTLTVQPQISDYNGFGVHCTGSTDGTIQLHLQGGTTPYQYEWPDGPQTRDRAGLAKGTYAVSVVDYHGCKTFASDIVVTEPTPLELRLAGQKDISCNGFRNGVITLEASGGAGPYQYSSDMTTWQPDSFFIDLPRGDYTLYAHDGNGCTTEAVQASLSQPTALELNQLDKVETTCGQANGMVLVEVTGGVRNYTYTWRDATNNVVGTTVRAEKLAAGDYYFVGTDANACTIEKRYTINDSDGPQVRDPSTQRLTCHDSNDGAIRVDVREGLAPYTISWDIPGESGLSVANVTGGEHWIKVVDSRGCQNKTDFFVDFPEALRITPSVTLPRCYGGSDGSIAISVVGGNPGGYTYAWTAATETGPLREGLSAGEYVLTVRDTKECELEQGIILNNPALYTVDAGGDRTICVGQELSLTAPGDALFCRWTSDAGYTNTAHNVVLTIPARYTLQVTNAKGCVAEDYFTIATSSDLLAADFLMAADAVAGDTVVLVDISWPVPDNIVWNFPAGTQVVSTDNTYASVIFPEAGEYDVVLNTHLGECLDNLIKHITIVGDSVVTNGRVEATSLTLFHIYPNPNEGAFVVQVAFATPANGQFSVIDLSGSKTFVRQSFAGQLSYEFRPTEFHNLPSGIYLLVLESAGERYYKRMIKR